MIKLIAFYLPAFHRMPENDLWWGQGFTEWNNVKTATPLFPSHPQPRQPTMLGYYDLSDVKIMRKQASLARNHGISGFCYYHYWFEGKTLLAQPLENMVRDSTVDMPFCLSWANETWTREWDGRSHEVLLQQTYGDERDWNSHFDYVAQFFRDPRYLCVDGKPIFLIYRPSDIPNLSRFLKVWDDKAKVCGFKGMAFVQMVTHFSAPVPEIYLKVNFEPVLSLRQMGHLKRAKYLFQHASGTQLRKAMPKSVRYPECLLKTVRYPTLASVIAHRSLPPGTFSGVFVNWDNTPRRGPLGTIVTHSSPHNFSKLLVSEIRKSVAVGNDYIFINAWNEWGEGCYLEPDDTNGTQYLEEIKRTLDTLDS